MPVAIAHWIVAQVLHVRLVIPAHIMNATAKTKQIVAERALHHVLDARHARPMQVVRTTPVIQHLAHNIMAVRAMPGLWPVQYRRSHVIRRIKKVAVRVLHVPITKPVARAVVPAEHTRMVPGPASVAVNLAPVFRAIPRVHITRAMAKQTTSAIVHAWRPILRTQPA